MHLYKVVWSLRVSKQVEHFGQRSGRLGQSRTRGAAREMSAKLQRRRPIFLTHIIYITQKLMTKKKKKLKRE